MQVTKDIETMTCTLRAVTVSFEKLENESSKVDLLANSDKAQVMVSRHKLSNDSFSLRKYNYNVGVAINKRNIISSDIKRRNCYFGASRFKIKPPPDKQNHSLQDTDTTHDIVWSKIGVLALIDEYLVCMREKFLVKSMDQSALSENISVV